MEQLVKNKVCASRTREYSSWSEMRRRCYNEKCKDYPRYHAKGIIVCDRWKDSFENFLEDMGKCPEGYTLDRIDNNGIYEPSNCRWADQYTQTANRGEFNHAFTYNGKTMVLKAWSRELNIPYETLRSRIIYHGLSFEQAISEDPYNKKFELNGEKKYLKEWCEIYNTDFKIVNNRIFKHHWDLERALTQPIRRKSKKNKDIVLAT